MAKTTINEVARLAEVSPSSVSRSLRGLGGVSDDTTRRIRAAADQLGYSVSPAASRLATGRTGTVAIVMPYLTRWFFAELFGGAEQVFREAGLDLLVYRVGDTEMRQRYFSSGLLRKRVDGVLLVTLALTEPEIAVLRGLDVPICMVGAAVEGFSSIRIDDVESASEAVQHLVNLGHTRIGIISGDPNEPLHFTVPLERRAGYRATLEAAGIEPEPELEAHGAFTVGGGDEATVRLLSRRRPPTAIFAECDEMAFGALRAVRRVGLRVPSDVSVIGFDDHPMAEYFDLTTMAQDVAAQGRQIARQLVGAVVRCTDAAPVFLNASTRLVVRSTTSVAPSFGGRPEWRPAGTPTETGPGLLGPNGGARQLCGNAVATSGTLTTNRG
ncbi:MAG TPA: LacI family DNA-binding transcriptional regulator [Acidimicrobiales bacterium]|nr:LacI family DNA-binding transcriptional regulator [Acidimicrobiales bacterium]